MFGSVFRLVPKEGKKQAIIDYMDKRQEERPFTNVTGFVSSYLYDAGADMWGVAVFESEKAYRDNAADPAQDTWYRGLRELLQSDPEWHDGTIATAVVK